MCGAPPADAAAAQPHAWGTALPVRWCKGRCTATNTVLSDINERQIWKGALKRMLLYHMSPT